ncbi:MULTISPECIES: FBP domain-containing protein [Microbacterium]|uniref:FBP domain-containing protein n=1 Tax=Microbacterium aurugineum TaxID=2851642 RepID=A0ABY4J199_9MICO|nr:MULTISPECIES: FBP domain-containing protein [Microbacterium]PKQ33909.1 MAG: FBP domain-containing protein [Actinobacteria bacterium HGW-Actinobacteria-11]MCE0508781.1 FBP domain-containing protein [Microbacterium sp. KKR3/1]MCK8476564.1 FBP domain-containing protein [Microbacterium aurugineum]TFB17166.1 FBP domain-containing protein [Microbacterium sp. 3H14]UPL18594.1 FBP domain-containing protein [Microbacterium aurugineum]
MRPLTEADVRASFVNADAEELRIMEMPHDFLLVDWDYLDFFAWSDPNASRRGYVLIPLEETVVGIVLRATEPGRGRSGMCDICHTMQPGNQISLFSARRSGQAGRRGDSVGAYMCADLSCHENVRLAHPLAPNEVRAPGQADLRLDGTHRRMERFVSQVWERS